MTTRVEMTNRALLRIGADPILSEADPQAAVHLAVYDSVAEYLAAKPWSFLKKTVRLARLAGTPAQHWTYAFSKPTEFVGPPRAIYPASGAATPTTDYDISEDQILSSHPELWAKGTVLNNPAGWPGDFREGFTLLLMARLAMSIREDRVLHDSLRAEALGSLAQGGWGGLIGQAFDVDSASVPEAELAGDANPMLDVRWS